MKKQDEKEKDVIVTTSIQHVLKVIANAIR